MLWESNRTRFMTIPVRCSEKTQGERADKIKSKVKLPLRVNKGTTESRA